jgi:cell division protein FtsB
MLYRSLERVAKTDKKHSDSRLTPGRRSARVRPVIRVLLCFVAVVLIVDALVGERGLLASRRAERQYQALAAETSRQRAENERLREAKRRLEEDPAAIEEVARRELGLIRPGEKLFIIKDLAAPPAR